MEIVTLIIAVAALVVAVLAYARTGGIKELRSQVSALGSTTESLRVKTTDTLDTVRVKTADTLERLEKAVRGTGDSTPPPTPEVKKTFEGEKESAPVEGKPEEKKKDQ